MAAIPAAESRPDACDPGITRSGPFEAAQSSRCSRTATIRSSTPTGG